MHHFHIPVMGIAYTLETPIKVGHLGISSVMSIADHQLMESLRQYHCQKRGLSYVHIPDKHEEDGRANRITAYLNLVNAIVKEKLDQVKNSAFKAGTLISQYFEMLPERSPLKLEYEQMLELAGSEKATVQEALKEQVMPGSADVNIMTKLDKTNYTTTNQPLPVEYNDAHAALRGFANSTLESSVVFSAGINTRLYSYIGNFPDFFPDAYGKRKKGVIIKVSDYKSALIQGKFLAKKGVWVSEFRIESGLNCGGHAFATDGHLLGPILQEFKDKRKELFDLLYKSLSAQLYQESMPVPEKEMLPFRITVQGGVGTHEEQEFLINHYGVDSVGWGSPFLLVPEAITIDQSSRHLVAQAEKKALYLSQVSPLGVPFNNVRNTSEDQNRQDRILRGKPGSPCNKKYLVSNTEFSRKPVCTASRTYQKKKLEELEADTSINESGREQAYNRIVEKTCICNGLTNPALMDKGLPLTLKNSGISICPGPNIAYFNQLVTLDNMIFHIYGRSSLLKDEQRPNLFLKELEQYVTYFKNYFNHHPDQPMEKVVNYLKTFRENLENGIAYYKKLLAEPEAKGISRPEDWSQKLDHFQLLLDKVMSSYLGNANVVNQ